MKDFSKNLLKHRQEIERSLSEVHAKEDAIYEYTKTWLKLDVDAPMRLAREHNEDIEKIIHAIDHEYDNRVVGHLNRDARERIDFQKAIVKSQILKNAYGYYVECWDDFKNVYQNYRSFVFSMTNPEEASSVFSIRELRELREARDIAAQQEVYNRWEAERDADLEMTSWQKTLNRVKGLNFFTATKNLILAIIGLPFIFIAILVAFIFGDWSSDDAWQQRYIMWTESMFYPLMKN